MTQIMTLSRTTEVVLLLCGRFGGEENNRFSPLTRSEYNKLVRWLDDQGLNLELLLEPGFAFDEFEAIGLEWQRVKSLLARGSALALSVESWYTHGLWVISRADTTYPSRYRRRLQAQAPPLLYGAGDPSLLDSGGLAIVGSRDVDETGKEFTRVVSASAAQESITIISGGARGVDETSMLAAIDAGGKSVGVLADSLARRAVYGPYRDAIRDQRLVLISPYAPDARFLVGNAMARNKLIYALADRALVVSSASEKSGTLTGARENLEKSWAPLFVRSGNEVPEGNRLLIQSGGIPLSSPFIANADNLTKYLDRLMSLSMESVDSVPANEDKGLEIFNLIWPILASCILTPRALDEILILLNKSITKGQLKIWMDRAVAEGRAKKLTRPNRYLVDLAPDGDIRNGQQPLFRIDE